MSPLVFLNDSLLAEVHNLHHVHTRHPVHTHSLTHTLIHTQALMACVHSPPTNTHMYMFAYFPAFSHRPLHKCSTYMCPHLFLPMYTHARTHTHTESLPHTILFLPLSLINTVSAKSVACCGLALTVFVTALHRVLALPGLSLSLSTSGPAYCGLVFFCHFSV